MLVVSWEKVWPKGITLMPLRIDTIVILNKPFVKIEVVQVAVGFAEMANYAKVQASHG
jgi:hypothetical protein